MSSAYFELYLCIQFLLVLFHLLMIYNTSVHIICLNIHKNEKKNHGIFHIFILNAQKFYLHVQMKHTWKAYSIFQLLYSYTYFKWDHSFDSNGSLYYLDFWIKEENKNPFFRHLSFLVSVAYAETNSFIHWIRKFRT